jgi:hypothetical protein
MHTLFDDPRIRLLAVTIWAILVATAAVVLLAARPAAAGDAAAHTLRADLEIIDGPSYLQVGAVVPIQHGRRQLEARVWTDRGRDAVYQQGEALRVRFRVNDDAYVCVYNIDTEGRLRVLFPAHPGIAGRVRGGRVMSLPAPGADYDFVAAGPTGMELLVIVASRQPLASAWYDPSLDQVLSDDGEYGYDDAVDWDYWQEPEEWYELDAYEDGYEYEEDWQATSAAWSVHGLLVSGDPFVAIRTVNHHLLPPHGGDRDIATDYDAFHIERRYSYPRYLCGDCHGHWHGYDPYHDSCSVFSVRVNMRWRYHPQYVYIIDHRDWGPRYVYVRRDHVPDRYVTVKRTWGSYERRAIKREFRDRLGGGKTAPIPRGTRTYPKSKTTKQKSKDGYDWKDERYRDGRASKGWGGDTQHDRKQDWTDGRSKTYGGSKTYRGSTKSGAPRSKSTSPKVSGSKSRNGSSKNRSSGSGKVKSAGSTGRSSSAKYAQSGGDRSSKKSSGSRSSTVKSSPRSGNTSKSASGSSRSRSSAPRSSKRGDSTGRGGKSKR